MDRRDFLKTASLGAASLMVPSCVSDTNPLTGRGLRSRPNILWIVAEDMSPHWSCYGETTVRTPNIDSLAREGALFKRAFVTSPVCSPSRSAMITGMYQTTIGAHHHRSSYPGSEIYLPKHIKLLPEYFKQHGYYTVNGGPKTTVYHKNLHRKDRKLGKTDYNFIWDPAIYDSNDWKDRKLGQPFFAQLQLQGGKYRKAQVPDPVGPAKVKLPPYYPDHPVIREDWARYLNSIIYLDGEVGKILQRLEDEGIAANTAVFLWTDHGISHARGKQFLYDEGIQVPLIIRCPGLIEPGTVREDLVSHIDIAAASLYMAGITIPEYMEGRPLFGPDYKPRDHVFAARDRCDETLDCIRCVRTKRYKYIRNFYPNRAYLQSNRYKDNKLIIKTMRRLFAEGKLSPVQARLFAPSRPAEELYDLQKDPFEIRNLAPLEPGPFGPLTGLADSHDHSDIVKKMRRTLLDRMHKTNDLGLVPEPVIEELARKSPSRYEILRDVKNKNLLNEILDVIEVGQMQRDTEILVGKMKHPEPSVRWWAARKLGNLGRQAQTATQALTAALEDNSAGVRVASARALCKMDLEDRALPVLLRELKNDNQVVRHYAALALQDIGEKAYPAIEDLKAAKNDKYEYVRRVANHLVSILQGANRTRL